MSVTYYVALPFTRSEDGSLVPGEAAECQGASTAIRRAEVLARTPGNVGALAFKRSGDPNVGDFSDAEVIKTFGDVPSDLSEL